MKKIFLGLMLVIGMTLGEHAASAQLTPSFFYAKQSFVNQTSSISTTLFTPTVTGDYLIFIYQEMPITPGTGTSVAGGTLAWTDDVGAASNTSFVNVQSGNHGNSTIPTVIHAIAGDPVTLSVTYSPSSQFNPYTLYITIIGQ